MSEHRASLSWERESEDFDVKTYNRNHVWTFEGGSRVRASAAPAFRGDPDLVDPEEAFVASLSSCHMLTFLALAARKGLVVDTYADEAVGFMEKNAEGKMAITRVVLRPKVSFGGSGAPAAEVSAELHALAHGNCFIANSVVTEIAVEPR